MITVKKKIKVDYEPLAISLSIKCDSQSSPLVQTFDAVDGMGYTPNRLLVPLVLTPVMNAVTTDGSPGDRYNNNMANIQWYVDDSPISNVWVEGRDYDITQSTQGTNLKGRLRVFRNIPLGEVHRLRFECRVPDSRRGVFHRLKSDTLVMATKSRTQDKYALSLECPNAIMYNPWEDEKLLWDYKVAKGLVPEVENISLKGREFVSRYRWPIGDYTLVCGNSANPGVASWDKVDEFAFCYGSVKIEVPPTVRVDKVILHNTCSLYHKDVPNVVQRLYTESGTEWTVNVTIDTTDVQEAVDITVDTKGHKQGESIFILFSNPEESEMSCWVELIVSNYPLEDKPSYRKFIPVKLYKGENVCGEGDSQENVTLQVLDSDNNVLSAGSELLEIESVVRDLKKNTVTINASEAAWVTYASPDTTNNGYEEGVMGLHLTQYRDNTFGAPGTVKIFDSSEIPFFKFHTVDFMPLAGVITQAVFTFEITGTSDGKYLDAITCVGYNHEWDADSLTFNTMSNIHGSIGGTVNDTGSFQPLDTTTPQGTGSAFPITITVDATKYVRSAFEAGKESFTIAIVMHKDRQGFVNPQASMEVTFDGMTDIGVWLDARLRHKQEFIVKAFTYGVERASERVGIYRRQPPYSVQLTDATEYVPADNKWRERAVVTYNNAPVEYPDHLLIATWRENGVVINDTSTTQYAFECITDVANGKEISLDVEDIEELGLY